MVELQLKERILEDIPYYRDIPEEKNLIKQFYIANAYGQVEKTTDLLGALLLKWIKESRITLKQDANITNSNKSNIIIEINKNNQTEITDEIEKRIFEAFIKLKKDEILDMVDIKRFCYIYCDCLEMCYLKEEKQLISDGLIVVENEKFLKIFNSKRNRPTEKLNEEAIKLAGLKKYLKDYTLINERQPMEVHLFEDYLIYAQIFGIAKQVTKYFKEFYPEIVNESCYNAYDIDFIGENLSTIIKESKEAITASHDYSAGIGNYSSGSGFGGGFSNGGGNGRWWWTEWAEDKFILSPSNSMY